MPRRVVEQALQLGVGHLRDHLAPVPEPEHRRDRRPAVGLGRGDDEQDAERQPTLHVLGHEALGRRGQEHRAAADVVGGGVDEVAVGAQHPPRLLRLPEQQRHRHRPDRMQPQRQRGDHPEVAAAAMQRPEELGMLLRPRRSAPARPPSPPRQRRGCRRRAPSGGRASRCRRRARSRRPRWSTPARRSSPGRTARSPGRGCSSSRRRRPPPPVRRGSTLTAFIRRRSITSPSSQSARPATPWPPPRTAISSPASRPKRTAATTSAVEAHCAISAGRRSIIALNSARASSYAASPGSSSVPANPSRKRWKAVASSRPITPPSSRLAAPARGTGTPPAGPPPR